jgi:hypothetical protein
LAGVDSRSPTAKDDAKMVGPGRGDELPLDEHKE